MMSADSTAFDKAEAGSLKTPPVVVVPAFYGAQFSISAA